MTQGWCIHIRCSLLIKCILLVSLILSAWYSVGFAAPMPPDSLTTLEQTAPALDPTINLWKKFEHLYNNPTSPSSILTVAAGITIYMGYKTIYSLADFAKHFWALHSEIRDLDKEHREKLSATKQKYDPLLDNYEIASAQLGKTQDHLRTFIKQYILHPTRKDRVDASIKDEARAWTQGPMSDTLLGWYVQHEEELGQSEKFRELLARTESASQLRVDLYNRFQGSIHGYSFKDTREGTGHVRDSQGKFDPFAYHVEKLSQREKVYDIPDRAHFEEACQQTLAHFAIDRLKLAAKRAGLWKRPIGYAAATAAGITGINLYNSHLKRTTGKTASGFFETDQLKRDKEAKYLTSLLGQVRVLRQNKALLKDPTLAHQQAVLDLLFHSSQRVLREHREEIRADILEGLRREARSKAEGRKLEPTLSPEERLRKLEELEKIEYDRLAGGLDWNRIFSILSPKTENLRQSLLEMQEEELTKVSLEVLPRELIAELVYKLENNDGPDTSRILYDYHRNLMVRILPVLLKDNPARLGTTMVRRLTESLLEKLREELPQSAP